MVYWPRSGAQTGIGADRLVDEPFGTGDRLNQGQTACQKGSYGGRIGTPGTVRVRGIDAGGAKLRKSSFVEEKVHRIALEMSALNQDRRRSKSGNPHRRIPHLIEVLHRDAGQLRGFV